MAGQAVPAFVCGSSDARSQTAKDMAHSNPAGANKSGGIKPPCVRVSDLWSRESHKTSRTVPSRGVQPEVLTQDQLGLKLVPQLAPKEFLCSGHALPS